MSFTLTGSGWLEDLPRWVGGTADMFFTPGGWTPLGPQLVANGGFDANVNSWALRAATQGVITWNAGVMRFERQVGLSNAASQLVGGLVIGQSYLITGRIRVVSGPGLVSLRLLTSDGGGGSNLQSVGVANSTSTFAAVSALWLASQTSVYVSVNASVDGTIVEADDISVRRA